MDVRYQPIVLKNSPKQVFITFSGVLHPLPWVRSSILDRSMRSIFQPWRMGGRRSSFSTE